MDRLYSKLESWYSGERGREVLFWLVSALIVYFLGGSGDGAVTKLVTPLAVVAALAALARFELLPWARALPYLLFFAISFTSLVGLTQTLTGARTGGADVRLYGLSFYTASLAFVWATKARTSVLDAFKIANPLLLATGPIALFVRSGRHVGWGRRLNYYLPFVIVGAFFYQIVAGPLVELFVLRESTDVVSSVVFAGIFELFVYGNFCGLSLMVFGVCGILGYRIPLNFRQPFSSANIVDFWRGWHTSLSTVLKTLFYVPLQGRVPRALILFVVFTASAIWHGISVNFILWGAFHAGVFVVSLWFLKRGHRVMPAVLLFVGVVFGRLLFADSNTERLLQKLSFKYEGFGALERIFAATSTVHVSLATGLILIFAEVAFRSHRMFSGRNYKYLRTPVALLALVVVGVLLAMKSGSSYAVYGQR